jgi:hypothetical protein
LKYLYNPATNSFEPLEPTLRDRFELGGRVNLSEGTGSASFMSPNMKYKFTGESDELRIQPPLGMVVLFIHEKSIR